MRPVTDAATFCATLVDEWGRRGVTDAVVCPGSRSTPLALALADSDLRVHVHHDERSAAFMALGLGLASGRPPVVLTTSGTATVNLHPAVVEADLSGVPMIVCTADRPPWLQGRGAPQTIDQRNLYGPSVRAFHDPGVPDVEQSSTWRDLAGRVWSDAMGPDARPGPVQLNLAFDEPLTGDPGPVPPADEAAQRSRGPSRRVPWPFEDGVRGVVVVGRTIEDPEAVGTLAAALGWPVVADPRSGIRSATTILHADALLRHPATAERLRPEAVLRVGEPPSSRVLNEWIAASGAFEVGVADRPIDPWMSVDEVVLSLRSDPVLSRWGQGLQPPVTPVDPSWIEEWRGCEDVARTQIAAVADVDPLCEPGVARTVASSVPEGGALVLSSSMPVRDVEWYAGPAAPGVEVFSNRGANGIDGVTSTAVGIALTGRHTVALLGDVAFLHDTNGLIGLAERDLDLTLVVVDNDGGGIFSFLPQARDLSSERFEQLFGTPHGVDLSGLAAAHGLVGRTVANRSDLADAIDGTGPRIVLVRTDRTENTAVHDAINAAVADALGRR